VVAAPPKPADNSYCLVCHANFKAEKLAAIHQKAGIGCAECHGESDRHSADEDGVTPPEIMFAKDKINAACMICHEEAKVRANAKHAVAEFKQKTCSDCHGEHRMAARTRHWDKTTGKLIKAEGVRMMQKDTPATSAR
jgi:formate-dependent nitrite reductase cytochrome c552 subunit